MKNKHKIVFLFAVLTMIACTATKDKPIVAELAYKIPSKLGEGAFWNYKTKELYWIDIEQQQVHVFNPKTKKNKTIQMPSKIGTVVPSETAGMAVVALSDGIYTENMTTQQLELLSDVESEIVANRFNDGKCDPNGNLWVGSMHLKQDKPNAKLYKIAANGKATEMLDNVTISNGIVWTKDGKTMYYIDTPTGVIKAYDFNLENSTISNGRIAVEVHAEDGFPDGMAIDENDNLWVGMWNGNAVAQYNPRTGKLMSKIKVPAHNITSCAFGGENLETLYITSASVDMNTEERKRYKLAGSIFKVKPGVKGVKSTFYGQPKLK
ncbi:MAG: SMP-30/gluconolactonase/LRE family protein [Flavobacteriaceae bacterium]|nr:SMP-30/gluconolactonase/LRE family protein [Flavobacteriaceae bacterium]